jgi:hypothetical protein
MLTIADFHWDGFFWSASVHLPSWDGFQSRQGAYGSRDTDQSAGGRVPLVFAPEGRDSGRLTDSEVALARWAVEHEADIHAAFLAALLGHYRDVRAKYLQSRGDPLLAPEARTADDFKKLIGLRGINIHQIEKGGLPYVGLELGCTWDLEHGLGGLLHGTRVVEIGGADTAILLWIAERDARR